MKKILIILFCVISIGSIGQDLSLILGQVNNSAAELSISEVRSMLVKLKNKLDASDPSEFTKTQTWYVDIRMDGTRTILFEVPTYVGLANDAKAFSLEFCASVFELLFVAINEYRNLPLSALEIANEFKSLAINSMTFQNKEYTLEYNWEQILAELK